MMFWKKKQPQKVCLHKWYLTDSWSVVGDFDYTYYFEVSCSECGCKRNLDEPDFEHFKKHFKVHETN